MIKKSKAYYQINNNFIGFWVKIEYLQSWAEFFIFLYEKTSKGKLRQFNKVTWGEAEYDGALLSKVALSTELVS